MILFSLIYLSFVCKACPSCGKEQKDKVISMVLKCVEELPTSHTCYLLMTVFFFFRVDGEVETLQSILASFEKSFGLAVNFSKSEICFSKNTY